MGDYILGGEMTILLVWIVGTFWSLWLLYIHPDQNDKALFIMRFTLACLMASYATGKARYRSKSIAPSLAWAVTAQHLQVEPGWWAWLVIVSGVWALCWVQLWVCLVLWKEYQTRRRRKA